MARPEEVAGHVCEGLKSVRDCGGGPETKGIQLASERRAFAYRSLGHGVCQTMSLSPLMPALHTGVAPFRGSFKTHGLAEEGGSPQLTGCRGHCRGWNPLLLLLLTSWG